MLHVSGILIFHLGTNRIVLIETLDSIALLISKVFSGCKGLLEMACKKKSSLDFGRGVIVAKSFDRCKICEYVVHENTP